MPPPRYASHERFRSPVRRAACERRGRLFRRIREPRRCRLGRSTASGARGASWACSRAGDGYARMADKPPLSCIWVRSRQRARQSPQRRACTPMIKVVRDHATYHLQHDAPLGPRPRVRLEDLLVDASRPRRVGVSSSTNMFAPMFCSAHGYEPRHRVLVKRDDEPCICDIDLAERLGPAGREVRIARSRPSR